MRGKRSVRQVEESLRGNNLLDPSNRLHKTPTRDRHRQAHRRPGDRQLIPHYIAERCAT